MDCCQGKHKYQPNIWYMQQTMHTLLEHLITPLWRMSCHVMCLFSTSFSIPSSFMICVYVIGTLWNLLSNKCIKKRKKNSLVFPCISNGSTWPWETAKKWKIQILDTVTKFKWSNYPVLPNLIVPCNLPSHRKYQNCLLNILHRQHSLNTTSAFFIYTIF